MFAASSGMKHTMNTVYPSSNTLVEMTLGWEFCNGIDVILSTCFTGKLKKKIDLVIAVLKSRILHYYSGGADLELSGGQR